MTPAPVVPQVLYHYTCLAHGSHGIQRSQVLRPHRQPILGRGLVWLTDLDLPDAWALGLTNTMLCCDRTAVRVNVHPYRDGATTVVPWWHYARSMSRALRDILEDKGLPLHWWVSESPIPITGMIATSILWADHVRARAAGSTA